MAEQLTDGDLLDQLIGRPAARAAGAPLSALIELDEAHLSALGLGRRPRRLLLACAEVARRYQPVLTATAAVTSARRALGHLAAIRTRDREVLAILLLSCRLEARGLHEIAVGGQAMVSATPRDVFAPAVAGGASAIILAHNHPSGVPEPSAEDAAFTEAMVAAGKTLQIEVVDHLIVARRGYFSFHEAGRLPIRLPRSDLCARPSRGSRGRQHPMP